MQVDLDSTNAKANLEWLLDNYCLAIASSYINLNIYVIAKDFE